MPNTASAKKRVRQDEKRRILNRALKSEARTLMKRVEAAAKAGDHARAEEELRRAHSKLDRVAKRNIWHANNVSRKKARLAKLVARTKAASGPPTAE